MPKIIGRPSVFTPELAKRIVDYVRAGNYIETSAAAAGVHKQTLYDWFKRANVEKKARAKGAKPRPEEQQYIDFLDSVKKGLGEAEVRDVLTIGTAAQSQWQAAAWRLERKFPKKWGRREKVEHVGKDDGPIEIKNAKANLESALDKLAKYVGQKSVSKDPK